MDQMSRRSFLTRSARLGAAGIVIGGLPAIIEACQAASPATSAPAKSAVPTFYGNGALQLSWIENVEFDGSYIAVTKGYYKDAGIDVSLLTGGPNVGLVPAVQSGKALVGLTDSVITATAINQGADVKIIGAGYQKSPYAMMSMASAPIKTPQDMIGKRIGVPAGDLNGWNAFLKINNIDPSQVTNVPVQFDPSVLPAGEVDGFISFYQEEPSELAAKGVKTYVFLWDDFGFHILMETYTVTTAALNDPAQRAKIMALMTGEIRGWEDAVKDPAYGAQLTVNDFGKNLGLDLAEQTNEAKRAIDLIVTSDTKAHGLFYMTQEKINQTISTLQVAGVKADASMFTNEILDAIYNGKTSI